MPFRNNLTPSSERVRLLIYIDHLSVKYRFKTKYFKTKYFKNFSQPTCFKIFSMLLPFDHVLIEDVEFVLHHRHIGSPMFGGNHAEWKAIDKYGNKVGIRDVFMKKLPPYLIKGLTSLQEPTFFKVKGEKWERFESKRMCADINASQLSGTFIGDDGHEYMWDVRDFTLKTDRDTYALHVLTRGGWWL